ncbi:MAG TPA: PAS domain S-box protein [Polyangiales bacterium]|nr:PAS domain S-box protein [Polyangiales bacterium]
MRTVVKFEIGRWFAGVGGLAQASSVVEPPDVDSRVRRCIDGLPVTMFEIDGHGTYTAVAGGMIQHFGFVPAQLIGRSIFEYPRFIPGKNMMVRRALSGESVSFSGIWPRGRYMIRLEPHFDEQGRVTRVSGLGYDLAKPGAGDKQLEQLMDALRRSEQRFRTMCECAPLGIYVSTARFELGYVNPALCSMLGRPSGELLGKCWETLLHTDERASRKGPSVLEGAVRMARHDGAPIWTSLRMAEMRDDGEIVGYVGVVVDITQERAARLASERAQQDLRQVIECSPEGIAVVRDDRWIFVNRALVDALGYSAAHQLIGRHAGEIIHPDDRELYSSSSDERARELRYRKANGEYALMEIRPAALGEFEGAPALLLAARDITQRRKLEAQSLVTERLLSMGTLAAGIAHEINNPLAALITQLEWVSLRLRHSHEALTACAQAGVPELQHSIGEAREAAERVRSIVSDLKLFSRAEDERLGPVQLSGVLDSAVRMAWNELRHRARFVREYDELPLVQGNEARLGQVFLNLLINAAHAIPEGRADEHEILLRAGALDEHTVVIEVRDSGSGIPANILGRIFDPFFTTKPPGVGSGLGLSICQRIVTSMGGQIDVESEPGRGSNFRVTLSIAHACAYVPPPFVSLPLVESAGVRGRVLVIDDDPAMGSAIELVLADEHEVEVFTSARRALAELQTGSRYDAIVCDVMMPEMSGMDFHSELACTQPELATQIIFLTGGAFTLRAREFLDRIDNPRLDKPFDSQSLRTLVSQCVSRV